MSAGQAMARLASELWFSEINGHRGTDVPRLPASDMRALPDTATQGVCVSKVGGIDRSTDFQSVRAQADPLKSTHGLKIRATDK
jgi:hypothetical protein